MAKVKNQPLDGSKDIATKRTQLTIKYMVDYAIAHGTDEQRKDFKTFIGVNREELKSENGAVKFNYDLKAIRDEFIKVFLPALKKKENKEYQDPIALL